MNEDKATRYQRLKRWASVASLAWTAGLLVALIVSGASPVIRDLASRAADAAGPPAWLVPFTVVALYVVALAALHEAGALPLDLYRGLMLERRYGLATERAGRWLFDRARASLLGLVLGVAGAVLIYATLRWLASWWWVASAAALSLVAVALTVAGPVVLLPLFYDARPLQREPLRARLLALAARAGTPAIDAYELRLSDRTRKANAALAGLGRTRRILVSDTLLAEYSDDEIEVILAHELAHHVRRDIWKGIASEVLLTFGALFVAGRALAFAVPVLSLQGPTDVAALPVLALAAMVPPIALVPVLNAMSRHRERRADRFALALTGNPAAFTSAMRRLASQNLAEAHPSQLTRWLFCSHPPVESRLDMARRWTGEAGRAGDRAG